jgi:hypothetical protein
MAVRGDITIDWTASPRIIEVAAPSVEITMQDLYDTVRTIASTAAALGENEVIDGSGKESLGGGVLVGLTIKLLNAKVKFEDRDGPSWTVCDVSGGNLVAVDGNGDSMSPIEPAAYVTATKTASSSATLKDFVMPRRSMSL